MAGNWVWIVPLVLLIITGALFGIFIGLYYSQPAGKRNNTYLVLWIIFAVLAFAMLLWLIVGIFYKITEDEVIEEKPITVGEPKLVYSSYGTGATTATTVTPI